MSLGIPKVLAVGSFMMSVGAGMYLNPVLSGQFPAFFLDENGKPFFCAPTDSNVSVGLFKIVVPLLF